MIVEAPVASQFADAYGIGVIETTTPRGSQEPATCTDLMRTAHEIRPRRRLHRLVSGGLAVALVLASSPVAAAPAPNAWKQQQAAAAARFDEAGALEAAGDPAAVAAYVDAGRTFTRAARLVAPDHPDRPALLEALTRKALRAFELAHELAPPKPPSCSDADRTLLRDALAACDLVLAAPGTAADDLVPTRAAYDRELTACTPKKQPPVASPGPPKPPPETKPEAPEPGPATAKPPEPRADTTPAASRRPPPATPEKPPKWPNAGLGVSLGLMGVFGAVALGTGLSRVRSPFTGAAYDKILEAARASREDDDPSNDVSSSSDRDMCADGGQGNADVARACDRWVGLGRASLATGILAGLSLVAAATFLGLKLRRGRVDRHAGRPGLRLGANFGRQFGVVVSGSF